MAWHSPGCAWVINVKEKTHTIPTQRNFRVNSLEGDQTLTPTCHILYQFGKITVNLKDINPNEA